jgi:hypothetical protein
MGGMTADEALGRLLMLACVKRRTNERTAHVAPVDPRGVWSGHVDGATVESQIVQHRSDSLGDAASLPFARREKHWNLTDERAIDRSHAPLKGK